MPNSKSSTPKWLLPTLVMCALLFFTFADIAPWSTETYRLDAQKSRAQLGCTSLAQAIEAYVQHEANKKHELPTALRDLVQPPFGGSSFLRNGEADLLDPWSKPYEMERGRRSDGTEYLLITTTAPD